MHSLQDKALMVLVAAVSLAFAWILLPFYGAVLWATVAGVVFAPLQKRLVRIIRHRTVAALASMVIILVMVILPLTLIVSSLVNEAAGVYARIQAGEINIGPYLQQLLDALPNWAAHLLDRFGLTDLPAIEHRVSENLMKGSQVIAARAFELGQNTFQFIINLFVMLYLLFFLLRDGDRVSAQIKRAIPLLPEQQQRLVNKLIIVIRATVKGNIIIAVAQGALGGLIFWVLGVRSPVFWAVLMTVLALVPAVGATLVWAPVAIYFLVSGAVLKGVILIAYGVLVIGLVDNVLRPVLVGKDTRMPDYIVLISTLGGLALLGVNGFVIGPLIAALFMSAWDIFSGSQPMQP